MLSKILVPLDGSGTAETILPLVERIAATMRASVTVLHVASPFRVIDGSTERLPLGYLQGLEAKLAAAGIAHSERVEVSGEPTVEILHYAEDHGYDVIAMATHGRTGFTRWMLGSTTDRVIQASPIPVLLVRPNPQVPAYEPLHGIIVPLDGSANAEMAIVPAETLAKGLKLPVTLLRVIPELGDLTGFEPSSYDPKWDEQIERMAGDYLDKIARRLRLAGIEAARKVQRGDPAVRIIDLAQAQAHPIIVMASHGRSGVARWALGSVAYRVLHASPVPVFMENSQMATAK